jgi:hypothetical protein
MPRTKLTERVVAKLAAPTASGKQIIHWDEELRGFGVLCSGVTTVKSYIVQRDLKDSGKSRRVTIAHVTEIALADAKERARKMLVDMRGGVDPKAKPQTGTLQQTLDLYLQSARLRPGSQRAYASLVRIQLAPLKDRMLGSIRPDEVDALFNSVKGKSAANAAMTCLKLLYRWAERRDDNLPRCPVRLGKNEWHRTTPNRRPIPEAKLEVFYKAVQELPPMGRDYIMVLLFTGARRREIAGLRWAEVDFEQRLLRLPATRVKTGNAVDLPMNDVVHDVLVARRQLGDGDYVFPSREDHIQGDSWTRTLRAKTGIDFSLHDLRRTFITIADALDLSPYAIKALVNHALGRGVTETYIKITPERLRAPAQAVADKLKALCGIAPPSGNVQALRA